MEYTLRKTLLFAFIFITIGTAFAILLANLGIFGEAVRSSDFAAKWGTGFVLVEIVGSTVMAFKWEFFSTRSMLIVFDFKSPKTPGAKLVECSYEIIDMVGANDVVVDKREKIKLARDRRSGNSSLYITLPPNLKHEQIMTMNLKDDKGNDYSVTDYLLQHTEVVGEKGQE